MPYAIRAPIFRMPRGRGSRDRRYTFPWELVVRVWDCLLLEGWKIVFRVALALLGTNARAWRGGAPGRRFGVV